MHIQIQILHLQLRFALTVLDTFCKLYLEICDGIEMFEQINVFLLVSFKPCHSCSVLHIIEKNNTSRTMDVLTTIVKNMIVMVLGL